MCLGQRSNVWEDSDHTAVGLLLLQLIITTYTHTHAGPIDRSPEAESPMEQTDAVMSFFLEAQEPTCSAETPPVLMRTVCLCREDRYLNTAPETAMNQPPTGDTTCQRQCSTGHKTSAGPGSDTDAA